MNNDKKKQLAVDDIIQIATEQKVPPLYHTREINGVIVKTYPFIRGHSKIYNQDLPDKDIRKKDYSLLSAYKSELENQLELNRKNCIGQYNSIKLTISNWLTEKIQSTHLNNTDERGLIGFAFTVNTFLYWTMLGVEVDRIREDLQADTYQLVIEVNSTTFDISELIEKVSNQLSNIERVVSRSVDLYFEYVNIQSYLYDLEPEEILSEVETQIGRPEDFPKVKSVEWFNELKEQKMYQHENGKPHKTKIRKEIIRRHTREVNGQIIKPSMRQIRRHTT